MMEFIQSEIGRNTLIVLAILWVLPWKGYALWLAARAEHKWWFVILLIVNTLAILEIIYIFAVAKKGRKQTITPASTSTPQQGTHTPSGSGM